MNTKQILLAAKCFIYATDKLPVKLRQTELYILIELCLKPDCKCSRRQIQNAVPRHETSISHCLTSLSAVGLIDISDDTYVKLTKAGQCVVSNLVAAAVATFHTNLPAMRDCN